MTIELFICLAIIGVLIVAYGSYLYIKTVRNEESISKYCFDNNIPKSRVNRHTEITDNTRLITYNDKFVLDKIDRNLGVESFISGLKFFSIDDISYIKTKVSSSYKSETVSAYIDFYLTNGNVHSLIIDNRGDLCANISATIALMLGRDPFIELK